MNKANEANTAKEASKLIVFYDTADWEETAIPSLIGQQSVVAEPGHLDINSATHAAAAQIISIFSSSLVSKEILDQLPSLQHIATRSTGVDHIDLVACRSRRISVSNVPHYGERTVAEHTFALILALSRKIYLTADRTRRGNFSRAGLRGWDLEGKTLGLIGCGQIGRKVAAIAQAFAMNIIIYDPQHKDSVKTLEELLSQADVISLHVPLTSATEHLINMSNVQNIKRGAILINTARGGVVQTAALLKALDEKILSGVGLDVLEQERLIHEEAEILSKSLPANHELSVLLQNHVLLNHPNVLITPHNAFNSAEAVQKIMDTTVENIQAFLKGEERNLVK